MVSTGLSCNAVTKRCFHEIQQSISKRPVLHKSYLEMVDLGLFEKLFYSDNCYYFVQEGASSHTSKSCPGVIVETEGSIQKTHKRARFRYKKGNPLI